MVTKSEVLGHNAHEILDFCDQLGTLAKHILTAVNVHADALNWRSPVQTKWMLCKRVDAEGLLFWGGPRKLTG